MGFLVLSKILLLWTILRTRQILQSFSFGKVTSQCYGVETTVVEVVP